MHSSKFLSYGPLALFGALAVLNTVNANGYVAWPASRQASCKDGKQDADFCDGVEYEPQSVTARKGAPFQREVADAVCNGNGARFDILNTQNETLWPKGTVLTGQDVRIEWALNLGHLTTGYFYYLTKRDWDQSKTTRLTKDDFVEKPALYVDGHDETPPLELSHALLASQIGPRLGYTVILAVWEIADSPDSFYNCIDLNILPLQGMTVQGETGAPA